jgi:hypothetical protein
MRLLAIIVSAAAIPLSLLGGSLAAAAGWAILALLLIFKR